MAMGLSPGTAAEASDTFVLPSYLLITASRQMRPMSPEEPWLSSNRNFVTAAMVLSVDFDA